MVQYSVSTCFLTYSPFLFCSVPISKLLKQKKPVAAYFYKVFKNSPYPAGGRGWGSISVIWKKYLAFAFVTIAPTNQWFFYQLLAPNYWQPPNLWAKGQSIAEAMNPMLRQWKENTRISIWKFNKNLSGTVRTKKSKEFNQRCSCSVNILRISGKLRESNEVSTMTERNAHITWKKPNLVLISAFDIWCMNNH